MIRLLQYFADGDRGILGKSRRETRGQFLSIPGRIGGDYPGASLWFVP
jgi:hypothetical protein